MKSCRTCKFSRWHLTPKGNAIKGIAGTCKYIVRWPPIPIAQRMNIYRDKVTVWPWDGKNCECYKSSKEAK